jgi:hypothetical protein
VAKGHLKVVRANETNPVPYCYSRYFNDEALECVGGTCHLNSGKVVAKPACELRQACRRGSPKTPL